MTPETKKQYDTGAVRSGDCEETRYDLISPIGLEALARTYAEGARKFGAFNWENGMPVTDLLNHALAHVYKFLGGDRSEDHLAHAAWNLLGAIHSLKQWPHLNEGHLRGDGCLCPPIADKGASDEAAKVFEQIGSNVYAVDVQAPDLAASLESLKQAILSADPVKK